MAKTAEVVKALADREEGEVWEENGLTLRMNFGSPVIENDGEYTEVEVDDGITHDFDANPLFIGVKLGLRTIPSEDAEKGDSILHLFKGIDGRRYSAWGSYMLDKGLAGVEDGQSFVAEYLGKREISRGRTIKQYRVLAKK